MHIVLNVLLFLCAIIGFVLIGIGLFAKINVYEGEKIEKFNQFKIITRISNIILGLNIIFMTYLCYKDKISLMVLTICLVITEIIQRIINKIYIKSDVDIDNDNTTKITELAEKINLDEILEENFFEEKIEEEDNSDTMKDKIIDMDEKEVEELIQEGYAEYRIKKKNENIKKINYLISEGIKKGILSETQEETNKATIEEITPTKDVLTKLLAEDSKESDIIEVDFANKRKVID